MKKYFPLLISLVITIFYLIGHYTYQILDITASPTSTEKITNAHYETVYSKMSFKTFKKEEVKLKNIKAPVVIINFWASWCRPCIEEFPSLVALRKKFNEKELMIYGINSDDVKQLIQIKRINKQHKLNFPIVADIDGTILEKFMISHIPVSIIYYKGKVVEVNKGAKDFVSKETIEMIKKYIKL